MPKVSGKPAASPGKTVVQTLIFPKDKFDSASAAKKWARDHDFKAGAIDVTGSSYRIRQFNPGDFQSGSLRTITIGDGVKAVVGRPKKTKVQKQSIEITAAQLSRNVAKLLETSLNE